MNKKDFARSLAEANNISYKQGEEEVNRVLGHILAVVPTLADGDALNLTGIASFTVKDVAERPARNPQTNEAIIAPATRQVRASIGSTLKKAVKASL